MYAVTRSIPPSRTTAYVYLGIGATIISIALGLLYVGKDVLCLFRFLDFLNPQIGPLVYTRFRVLVFRVWTCDWDVHDAL